MVGLLRDEPGLLGYYVAGEPEINSIRAEYLESLYRLLCELDPHHPVILTNDMLERIEKLGYRACDVLNPDPYSPKPGGAELLFLSMTIAGRVEVATECHAVAGAPCRQNRAAPDFGSALVAAQLSSRAGSLRSAGNLSRILRPRTLA